MRHKQSMTWNMARIIKKKNLENTKCTLHDLEYGKKTEKR